MLQGIATMKTIQASRLPCLGFVLWILTCTIHAIDVLEICESGKFLPKCGQNEVVLITHARYGRMQQGGCITAQHKTGCATDARKYLDAKCSGRRECAVDVASLIPEEEQPCPRDLRSYLEVVYECVKVVNASKNYCENSEAVEVSEQKGYLSSLVTSKTGCGSLDSPWWVTVKPGQTIELTLLDFGITHVNKDASSGQPVCHVYAVIKEQGAMQPSETVCAGSVREKLVFTSSTNRLEVRLVTRSQESLRKDSYFLFRFEAKGCPNIPKPQNGWVKRTGNEVTIGCDGDEQEYKLHCEGNRWSSEIHNCSEGMPVNAGSIKQHPWSLLHQKHGLSVLIILCIAVSVGLCILAVGLVHIKRKRRAHETREEMKRRIPEEQYGPPTAPDKPAVPLNRPYNKTGDSTEFYHSSENDYYRTWQLQRHAPQQMAPLPAVPSGGMHASPQFHGAHAHMPMTCSTHSAGTGSSGGYQKSTQSANEHIYESPKFDRKDYSSDDYEIDGINSEYFELDPDSNKTS